MIRVRSRIDVMRTVYNTDDAENPKEIATLYDVFEYVDGKKGDTLHYMTIIRQKSRIVFKEGHGRDFIQAMIRYHRTIRGRAEDMHPCAKMLMGLEKLYESGAYEP